jgi:predicted nucleic acid-binding protein
MIFADTTALASLLIPADTNHKKAVSWIEQNAHQQVITTDYIIDELYTLILVRSRSKRWTVNAVNRFLGANWISELIFVTREDFFQAEQVFLAYQDKGWSFTDCTCKIVIDRLGIPEAFTFDEHFSQFGSVSVVPSV